MPRSSLDALAGRVLAGAAGGTERYVDMRVDVVRKATEEILLSVGGRWDRQEKRYAEAEPETRVALRVHDGQLEAAEWFSRWVAARARGEYLETEEGRPVFSIALVGGRGGGKSDLGIRMAVTYATEFPRSIVWIVAPTIPDTPELHRALEEILPLSWYTYSGSPWFVYALANGSEIHVKSSHPDPSKLKRGRHDLVVINEAQLQPKRVYEIVRFRIADRGGLVVLCANPPDRARGQWVEDYYEKARAGKMGGKVFVLHAKKNTELRGRIALENLEDDILDERTIRRDRDGEFGLPRAGAVFYGFSEPVNVERAPSHPGITERFLDRHLGYASTWCLGMDFQKTPFQIATCLRFYEDPSDPDGDPLVWIVEEHFVRQGLEDDLVDLLEANGHTEREVVIPDASGDWQNSERTKGRSSWDRLRARQWVHLFTPDALKKNNPDILERVAVGNSLMKAESGRRKLRIDPRCTETINSIKNWELRNGIPNRRSEFAHAADSWTYPCHRLFPRRKPSSTRIEYQAVPRLSGARKMDIDEL